MADDEGWLHDSGELNVAVSFMLTLELVQQGLIGGLGEARETVIQSATGTKQKHREHQKFKFKAD